MKVEAAQLLDQVIDEDGSSVVMVDNQVMVLSALATEVLAVLGSGPRHTTELVAHLRKTFGDPGATGDADALVADLVEDLRSRAVVRVVTSG